MNTDNKKTAAILAVRYNSTRLHGKCIMPLAGETSILSLIIKRLRSSKTLDDVIVSTTENTLPYIKEILEGLDCNYFVGSEEDVLGRYEETARKYKIDDVVRCTGDNPLVSIKALDLITEHHKKTDSDLSHYDELPWGSGVEVIKYSALKKASDNAVDNFEREHITQYHYRNQNLFKIEFPKAPKEFCMKSLVTTIDTIEQYEDVKNIFNKYNNNIYIEIDTVIEDIKNGK